MSCGKCNDERLQNYISEAKKEAQDNGFLGEIVILERADGEGYFWTGPQDPRIGKLVVADRFWPTSGLQLNRGADNEEVCESCSG